MDINSKNWVHNHCENLVKPEKIETKNTLIDEENFKDIVVYFTWYVHCKSIKMLSMYSYKLMGKIKKHEGKKLFDSWWLYGI